MIMKKSNFIAIFSILAFSLTATSCLGSSDSSDVQTVTVSCYNRIVDGDGDLLLDAANYVYEFDFVNATVSITTYDAEISSVAYVINDIPLSVSYTLGYTFSASTPTVTNTSGTELSSVAVTNFYGQFAGNTIKVTYTVNGSTTVYASPIEDYFAYTTTTTTPTDGGTAFEWTTAEYDIVYSLSSMTADMTVYTVKFSSDQPYTLSEMTVEGINIEPGSNRLKLSADAITPKINDVEYPDYELTNISGSIYPAFTTSYYFLNEYMALTFNCMDCDVSVIAYTFEQ